MADTVTPAVRSRIMSSVPAIDTKPELVLRRALHKQGIRYRLHVAALPGKPDLVFPKYRAVLLVHGCYWHRHEGCPRATTPASNVPYWTNKFSKNVDRDRRNFKELMTLGWRVGIAWECWIGKSLNDGSVQDVLAFLADSNQKTKEWGAAV